LTLSEGVSGIAKESLAIFQPLFDSFLGVSGVAKGALAIFLPLLYSFLVVSGVSKSIESPFRFYVFMIVSEHHSLPVPHRGLLFRDSLEAGIFPSHEEGESDEKYLIVWISEMIFRVKNKLSNLISANV
jgi:hypothetical protein